MADDAVGPGEGGIDRGLVAGLVEERLVARVLVPHRRRVRRRAPLRRVMTAGSGSYSIVDQLGGVLCLVQRLGDDERDRVADIADAILRQ